MNDNTHAKAQLMAAYKRLFLGSQDGKIVLADLASEARMDRSTFDENPHVSSYLQGRRDNVLDIFGKLNTDLVAFLTENVIMEDF